MRSNDSRVILLLPLTPPDKSALERWASHRLNGMRRTGENLLIDTFDVLGYFSDAVGKATVPTSRQLARSIRHLTRINDAAERTRLSPWVIPAAIALLALLY